MVTATSGLIPVLLTVLKSLAAQRQFGFLVMALVKVLEIKLGTLGCGSGHSPAAAIAIFRLVPLSMAIYVSVVLYTTTRICAGCKRVTGNNKWFEDNGTFFHPQCLHCRACGQPLAELELEISPIGIRSFHKSCHPKCDVCNELIPYKGGLEFRTLPFWSQKYCQSHEHENVPRCCGCERLEPRSTVYASLGDGRKLCSECRESAIMVTGECQQLYHAARQFCEGMNMRFDQRIPTRRVDWQTLFETLMHNGGQPVAHIRSLCMLKEYTESSWRTQPGKRKVVAILVLYGYPRLSLGSEIAQQMMHSWFFLKGYRNLAPGVEEGMCRVLSYLWLESSKKSNKSETEKKLCEFYMYKIANNDSPAHREAFRAAKAAVDRHGLRHSLEHIS